MARYTKTFLDKKHPERGAYRCDFVAWDSVSLGEQACEATHANDLFKPMNASDVARFSALSPGEVKTIDGAIEYFREW